MTLTSCFGCLIFLFTFLPLPVDDWPQFRGPDRDGKSDETRLLEEWPEGGPELVWTAEGLGSGFSSVSVVDQHAYTIGDVGDQQFAFCINDQNGEIVWKEAIGPANTGNYSGSRCTPTYHDGHLYCLNTEGLVLCLEAKNGDVVWQRDLVEDYGAQLMQAMGEYDWRFAESPLVDHGKVVVTPGSKNSVMVALDPSDGSEIWKTAMPQLGDQGADGAGYSSAVVSQACGVRQYVQLVGRGVISVDAETGEFLWGYNRVANDIANIASPVVDGDRVFVSTGYSTGSALLTVVQSSDGSLDVREEYFLPPSTFQNHHGGFVLHEGYIYGGHGHKLGFPVCLRLEDGEVMWGPVRNEGRASAAVSFADGHLYFRYENGEMILIEATPEEYRQKGSFTIPDVQTHSWSYPVISNGRLYLKEQDKLNCYDISKG